MKMHLTVVRKCSTNVIGCAILRNCAFMKIEMVVMKYMLLRFGSEWKQQRTFVVSIDFYIIYEYFSYRLLNELPAKASQIILVQELTNQIWCSFVGNSFLFQSMKIAGLCRVPNENYWKMATPLFCFIDVSCMYSICQIP